MDDEPLAGGSAQTGLELLDRVDLVLGFVDDFGSGFGFGSVDNLRLGYNLGLVYVLRRRRGRLTGLFAGQVVVARVALVWHWCAYFLSRRSAVMGAVSAQPPPNTSRTTLPRAMSRPDT